MARSSTSFRIFEATFTKKISLLRAILFHFMVLTVGSPHAGDSNVKNIANYVDLRMKKL